MHHAAYDLITFYGIEIGFWNTMTLKSLQTIFALAFIVISGISFNLSRSPIINGLKILGAASVVTIATRIFTPDIPIRFGILHFLGITILLTVLLIKPLEKIPPKIALPILAVLFIAAKYRFPISIKSEYLFPLGFVSDNFISSDYYPLIPWIFAFIFGIYLTKPLLERRIPQWMYSLKIPIVNFCGRNTMLIFLIHQPILLGLFWLLFNGARIFY
jgi:uncharacterized membrane protein